MQKFLFATAAATMMLSQSAPVFAAVASQDAFAVEKPLVTIDKRRKARVPGGSGCDDPRDLIEHPECRG